MAAYHTTDTEPGLNTATETNWGQINDRIQYGGDLQCLWPRLWPRGWQGPAGERGVTELDFSSWGKYIFTSCSAKLRILATQPEVIWKDKSRLFLCVLQCVNEAARLSLLKERNCYFFLFTKENRSLKSWYLNAYFVHLLPFCWGSCDSTGLGKLVSSLTSVHISATQYRDDISFNISD